MDLKFMNIKQIKKGNNLKLFIEFATSVKRDMQERAPFKSLTFLNLLLIFKNHHKDERNVGEEHLEHFRVDLVAGNQLKGNLLNVPRIGDHLVNLQHVTDVQFGALFQAKTNFL